jgi:NAD(P)-dependent dehydrogenase (short-subunit alcohol dehydrogenase family)
MDGQKSTTAAAAVGAGLVGWKLLQRMREADFRGKTALVTGSSRGLGFLIARELVRAGCRVVVCARNEPELRRAADALRREGADVLAVGCDVADRDQVENMIEMTRRHYGGVDILVNNAGIIEVGPIESMTLRDFEAAMDVMFWGVVHPTMAVLPSMQQRKTGWIVNVTSIGGRLSVPHLLPYNSAKFAAVGFSEGLRAEVAKDGVSVTTVCPGFMRTGSYLNALFKSQQEAEFAWFGLGSALPIVTMNPERAAGQIVRAARRGQAEVDLTFWAPWVARFHGLFPGTTSNLLAVANRLLPSYGGQGRVGARGMEIEPRLNSPTFERVTVLGRKAARRYHEFPGTPDVLAGGGQERGG